jgi:hypothetical protein
MEYMLGLVLVYMLVLELELELELVLVMDKLHFHKMSTSLADRILFGNIPHLGTTPGHSK